LRPWQAVVLGLLAGAFPDIDSLAQLAGDFVYLRHHRGITHSLLLAPLWAAGLALLLAPLWRSTRRPGGWRVLWPLALAALLLHIAADWITQFGTMLLEPLSSQRFGLGAMFIIDLVFSGILLGALLLAALLPARRWPAALGLLGACGWVALAWVGKQEAQAIGQQYAERQGISAVWVDTMPRPASPFNWTVTVFDGQRYHVAHLNTRRSQPLVAGPDANFIRRFSAPYLPADQAPWQTLWQLGDPATTPPWVAQAWQHEALATFRWFAQAPVLMDVVEPAPPHSAGGTGASSPPPDADRCAIVRDQRFDFPGRDESPFQYGLCLRQDGSARAVRRESGRLLPV
jgi:inner membrane protein